MQLNSLSLNLFSPHTTCSSQPAIYDHNIAIVNSQVFVYGKNISNFTLQTPLHKINLITLKIQPIFTVNAPIFLHMMMFCFDQHIFLWGKTTMSQDCQLYEFDGLKFMKIDQIGPVPSFNGPFSFTTFSHRYLLLFNCSNGIQFKNQWYLFDIKQRQWKQIVPKILIPTSEKSHLYWKNGRGYLLLQNCYNENRQRFHKNLFYEIKLSNSDQFILHLTQIGLPSYIRQLNLVFSHIFSIDEKRLFILGGQQIMVSQKQQQLIHCQNVKRSVDINKIDFQNSKIIFEFDLEAFQWSQLFKTVPIKGHNHKLLTYGTKIFTVGGMLGNSLMKEIQVFDMKKIEYHKEIGYEQSMCYYCECAFTYAQNQIYMPAIETDNQIFAPRNRMQNKFLKKFSQAITSQIHAIGILCEFLIDHKSYQIQINLSDGIRLHPKELAVKQKIQFPNTQILSIKSSSQQFFTLNSLIQSATGDEDLLQQNSLSLSIARIKLASFKLGYGLLYVASTHDGHIFVSYSSYSQTDFPQSNFKSFSQVFYVIKWNKNSKKYEYSSVNKRNIIFQNVKMHFGMPQAYEHTQTETKKSKIHPCFDIYVIGVSNLERTFFNESSKIRVEDIQIKSLNRKNQTNNLRTYLKHFYLTSNPNFKLKLQNVEVQFIDVYEKFLQLPKITDFKYMQTNDEACTKKSENQETHFSTNNDELISWKKLEMIDRCKIYEIPKNDLSSFINIYKNVFVYRSKKLLKTIQTQNSLICGVIELKQNVEVGFIGGNFAYKSDQRALMRWLEQIQNQILQNQWPSVEQT